MNWTAEVDATYRVFASPKESPDDGARTDEVDPYLAGGTLPATGASPYGWHDTDGVLGGETILTSGNNVNACTDIDANNVCDVEQPAERRHAGPLVFHPALDLATQQPADYRDAAVVNLFYWNNVIHDIAYQYGFDEVAGNFQENNYGERRRWRRLGQRRGPGRLGHQQRQLRHAAGRQQPAHADVRLDQPLRPARDGELARRDRRRLRRQSVEQRRHRRRG